MNPWSFPPRATAPMLLLVGGIPLLVGWFQPDRPSTSLPTQATTVAQVFNDRLPADTSDRPPPSASGSSAADTTFQTIIGAHVGDNVAPMLKHIDGSFQEFFPDTDTVDGEVIWKDDRLALHNRYFVDAPPRIFTVKNITLDIIGEGHPEEPLEHGSTTEHLSSQAPHPRLDVGSEGGLAFSLPPGVSPNLQRWIPTSDTTLTPPQVQTIADHVSRRLAERIAKRNQQTQAVEAATQETIAQHASTLLTSRRELHSPTPPISEIEIDVTSEPFDNGDSSRYLVVIEHEYQAVFGTLTERNPTSSATKEKTDCHVDILSRRIDSISADDKLKNLGLAPKTIETACLKPGQQAAAFVGHIAGGEWKPVASEITTTDWGIFLPHVITIPAGNEIILLFDKRGPDAWINRIVQYKNGTFEEIKRF